MQQKAKIITLRPVYKKRTDIVEIVGDSFVRNLRKRKIKKHGKNNN